MKALQILFNVIETIWTESIGGWMKNPIAKNNKIKNKEY
jgi:hypothetical protein